MNSMSRKIKIRSSVLAFCLKIIQFILYNHFQNDMCDHCKTVCLPPVKSIEELGSLKEKKKENIHHLLESYYLVEENITKSF